MIISHKVTKTIEKHITDDIICNKCGNNCKTNDGMTMGGLIEVNISGGYGSKLGDGSEYQFSMCEICLIELFKSFKHPALLYTLPQTLSL